MTEKNPQRDPEPMWPSLMALAAVGGLHAALPEKLAIMGPRWLLVSLVACLIIPGEVFHRRGKHTICRIISYAVLCVITSAMIYSVMLLVQAIPRHEVTPGQLLGSAAILWLTNILVFAVWYWRLDAGGPHKRDQRESHTEGAFLFPQMTIQAPIDSDNEPGNWTPRFIDYLFLAFNSSTALSPTDSPVLSRWAKVLMMIQAVIALTIVALLAARAVNIL